ncbi:MAG: protein phosphatase 2C domain-containing protein [Oscillospiraceae bacterium]|nr:protein phosphatase 2C domain-containing protein [Oscillospiraceae bacterium]
MQGSMFRRSAYSEVGESHLFWGKDCEDTVVTGENSDTGVSACVVSDGAGSYQYAKDGSEITAHTALQKLLTDFDNLYKLPREQLGEVMLSAVRVPLIERAMELGCGLEELSATLVCAAMAADGRYLYFHVGDGVIAACDMNGECRIISQYYHEIAPNFTTFVTIEDTPFNAGKGRGGVAAFLLTSDGPEMIMTSENGWMTAQAELLLQMGIFFPPHRMEDEFRKLTYYYKELGMYDDASFAIISDRRYAPYVFDGMDESLRNLIFLFPERIPRRVTRQILDCFLLLAAHPEGVTEKQMTRALHTHRNWNTFHKLLGLLTTDAIRLHEGRYYF